MLLKTKTRYIWPIQRTVPFFTNVPMAVQCNSTVLPKLISMQLDFGVTIIIMLIVGTGKQHQKWEKLHRNPNKTVGYSGQLKISDIHSKGSKPVNTRILLNVL